MVDPSDVPTLSEQDLEYVSGLMNLLNKPHTRRAFLGNAASAILSPLANVSDAPRALSDAALKVLAKRYTVLKDMRYGPFASMRMRERIHYDNLFEEAEHGVSIAHLKKRLDGFYRKYAAHGEALYKEQAMTQKLLFNHKERVLAMMENGRITFPPRISELEDTRPIDLLKYLCSEETLEKIQDYCEQSIALHHRRYGRDEPLLITQDLERHIRFMFPLNQDMQRGNENNTQTKNTPTQAKNDRRPSTSKEEFCYNESLLSDDTLTAFEHMRCLPPKTAVDRLERSVSKSPPTIKK